MLCAVSRSIWLAAEVGRSKANDRNRCLADVGLGNLTVSSEAKAA